MSEDAAAVPLDVIAGQLTRLECQHRQCPPDLAVKVEDTVQQVVEERADGAVEMRLLPAIMAMRSDQLGPAVKAGVFVEVPLPALCRACACLLALHRARIGTAFHRRAESIGQITHVRCFPPDV